MRLEVLDGVGRPAVLHAARIVVTLDDGTPFAALAEWSGGVAYRHCGDPDFNDFLRQLGVDRTTLVVPVAALPPAR